MLTTHFPFILTLNIQMYEKKILFISVLQR